MIDCYDADIFDAEGFLDTDHLNVSGAIKISNILKGVLEELEVSNA